MPIASSTTRPIRVRCLSRPSCALADMFDALVAPLVGRKDVLERAVPVNGAPVPEVRSFAPKWRSLGESNPSFQIENLTS